MTAERWREDARCRQVDPELWSSKSRTDQVAAAKLCALCPVQQECLAYAVAWRSRWDRHERPYGVWGGWFFPFDDHQDRVAPRPVLVATPTEQLVAV